MLREPRRLLSAGLAILLGIAFVTTTLVLGDTMDAAVRRSAAASVGDASVVVTRAEHGRAPHFGAGVVDAVRAVPGVARVDAELSTIVWQRVGPRDAVTHAMTLPAGRVTAGRLPATPDEAAVNAALLSVRRAQVGDMLVLSPDPDEPGRPVRIVGVLDPSAEDVPTSDPVAFGSAAGVMAWSGVDGYTQLVVSGGDPVATQRAVSALPGIRAAEGVVRTGQDEVAARLKKLQQGTQVLTGLLLGFGVIALLVAALVIANTFAVLVAQRTRQLALLRCVGATRGQLVRLLLRESLGLGVAGSALGLLGGIGLAALGVQLSAGATEIPLREPTVTPASLAVPAVVGVTVTVLAALVPARNATRVAPLAALRPELVATPLRTLGRVRLGLGLLGLGAGAVLLGVTVARHSLPLGLAGGVLSFGSVMLLAPWLVPAVASGIGAVVARPGGVTGRLAVDNVRRNPRRAAATAGALLIGVTLITTMVVGAATGQRSVTAALDREYPSDAQVAASAGPLTPELVAATRRAPSVERATRVDAARVTVTARSGATEGMVLAVDPHDVAGLRDPGLISGLADGVLLASPGGRIAHDETVTLAAGPHTLRLRAVVRADGPKTPMVTAGDLRRLVPEPERVTGSLWVSFTPGADPAVAMERLGEAVAPAGGVADGPAQERAQMEKLVDLILWVVVALLAVAVLIALVGVGNTLGLAVLERTRESGLLRALGLTRGQLRAAFGAEALVLSGVAALLGVGLGVAYGIVGAYALMGGDLAVRPAVPWVRIGLVVAVALAAGWLASVIPARQGARVSPTVALATE